MLTLLHVFVPQQSTEYTATSLTWTIKSIKQLEYNTKLNMQHQNELSRNLTTPCLDLHEWNHRVRTCLLLLNTSQANHIRHNPTTSRHLLKCAAYFSPFQRAENARAHVWRTPFPSAALLKCFARCNSPVMSGSRTYSDTGRDWHLEQQQHHIGMDCIPAPPLLSHYKREWFIWLTLLNQFTKWVIQWLVMQWHRYASRWRRVSVILCAVESFTLSH